MSGELPEIVGDWRLERFQGGTLDGRTRYVRTASLEVGTTYELIITEEVWAWDGEAFVLGECGVSR
jgi:hypothetical protein